MPTQTLFFAHPVVALTLNLVVFKEIWKLRRGVCYYLRLEDFCSIAAAELRDFCFNEELGEAQVYFT